MLICHFYFFFFPLLIIQLLLLYLFIYFISSIKGKERQSHLPITIENHETLRILLPSCTVCWRLCCWSRCKLLYVGRHKWNLQTVHKESAKCTHSWISDSLQHPRLEEHSNGASRLSISSPHKLQWWIHHGGNRRSERVRGSIWSWKQCLFLEWRFNRSQQPSI